MNNMITHEPYDTKRIYSVKSSLFKDRVEIVVNDGREPTADELGLMAAARRSSRRSAKRCPKTSSGASARRRGSVSNETVRSAKGPWS